MKSILYFLSLQMLYLLIFILTFKVEYLTHLKLLKNYKEIDLLIVKLFQNTQELVFFLCILLFTLGIVFYYFFKNKINKNGEFPFKINKVSTDKYDHHSFISVYIVPLIAFDFTSMNHLIFLIIYLVAMGFIYIETSQFYTNPTLLFWGYHIYKVETTIKGKERNLILISRNKLSVNNSIKYIKLTEDIIIGKINI